MEAYMQQTVDALCAEMARWQGTLEHRQLDTIFIGGGTPTLLDAPQLAQLFTTIDRTFLRSPTCEITCEANPGTVDRGKFETLRAYGVNRLSIGVQSFQPQELQFLGRIHDTADVVAAFAAARQAGFENVNLDFIFGLPGQSAASWQATLEEALALQPEHLSLYSLIVEPNTPLYHWVATGQVADTDEDCAAEQYEIAMARLGAAGYLHYEVSNWARPQQTAGAGAAQPRACEHNLIYWRNEEYLGIGPGAHSHLCVAQDGNHAPREERRWGNRKPVPGYIKRIARGAEVTEFSETITPRLAMGETMMLGLRLLEEGVTFARFQERFGVDLRDVFADELARLAAQSLVRIDAERIRLSTRGLMVGNQVFSQFLPDV
jgi:oxygen-independent coproporphyrinogen-3 oxidase